MGIEKITDALDYAAAFDKTLPALLVGDEVEVALA